jgi:hypothetical protein
MEAFQARGYLRKDANFFRGLEGGQPLSNLLACQWDVRFDQGRPVTVAPGLFLEDRPASSLDSTQTAILLRSSSTPALLRLASVLDCRVEDGDFALRMQSWQSLVRKSRIELLEEFATTANLEGFEGMAAENLSRAPPTVLTLLEIFLRGSHTLAALVLRGACSRNLDASKLAETERDGFTDMLAAVCSMAGAEDASNLDSKQVQ